MLLIHSVWDTITIPAKRSDLGNPSSGVHWNNRCGTGLLVFTYIDVRWHNTPPQVGLSMLCQPEDKFSQVTITLVYKHNCPGEVTHCSVPWIRNLIRHLSSLHICEGPLKCFCHHISHHRRLAAAIFGVLKYWWRWLWLQAKLRLKVLQMEMQIRHPPSRISSKSIKSFWLRHANNQQMGENIFLIY